MTVSATVHKADSDTGEQQNNKMEANLGDNLEPEAQYFSVIAHKLVGVMPGGEHYRVSGACVSDKPWSKYQTPTPLRQRRSSPKAPSP
jgi:hypothetical protein